MNKTGQGVQQQSKLIRWLIHILLLLTFCLSQTICAETIAKDTTKSKLNNIQKFHIALMYSPESTLQTEIAEKLSTLLQGIDENIYISSIAQPGFNSTKNSKPGLVIAVGLNQIQYAKEYFTKTNKLFIASDPGENGTNINPSVQNAVLYMTQPYCRQAQFIKQINKQWQTFSYLSNPKKPVDDQAIEQCAIKYGLTTYKVNTIDTEQLTNDIKNALSHSDLILALPDKNIYNRQTVKNILLTSYRYRKPVVAFSRNFVNAGALASIHSDTEQISKTANTLIEQYISNNYRFEKAVNYPQAFDISINRQVFKALDLDVPDVSEIYRNLENPDSDKPR